MTQLNHLLAMSQQPSPRPYARPESGASGSRSDEFAKVWSNNAEERPTPAVARDARKQSSTKNDGDAPETDNPVPHDTDEPPIDAAVDRADLGLPVPHISADKKATLSALGRSESSFANLRSEHATSPQSPDADVKMRQADLPSRQPPGLLALVPGADVPANLNTPLPPKAGEDPKVSSKKLSIPTQSAATVSQIMPPSSTPPKSATTALPDPTAQSDVPPVQTNPASGTAGTSLTDLGAKSIVPPLASLDTPEPAPDAGRVFAPTALSSAVSDLTGPAAAVRAYAPQVLNQIATALVQISGATTEIALNPEELGRVRLSLTKSDAGMLVNIMAERPETADLIRRNLEHLTRDLRDLGYENPTFTFEDQSGADNQNTDNNAPWANRTADPALTTPIDQPIPGMRVALSGGLDLKL